MESITIYPKNEKQKSLLKSLLKEMKIRFEVLNKQDSTEFSEQEYFQRIDKSIEQASIGKLKRLTQENQKNLLGL